MKNFCNLLEEGSASGWLHVGVAFQLSLSRSAGQGNLLQPVAGVDMKPSQEGVDMGLELGEASSGTDV